MLQNSVEATTRTVELNDEQRVFYKAFIYQNEWYFLNVRAWDTFRINRGELAKL